MLILNFNTILTYKILNTKKLQKQAIKNIFDIKNRILNVIVFNYKIQSIKR